MIDFHCHSNFSDGLLSPSELIQKALNNQVRCLALTDHDTVEGLADFQKAAENTGLLAINGIEISTRWKKYDIHILGLNINPVCLELKTLIDSQAESRISRAKLIADALLPMGIENAYEKALNLAGHARPGRPHFARLLINEGKVYDMKSAFSRYLGRGKLAYVPAMWVDVPEAVRVILASGGVPVIAHPLKYALTRTKLHALIIDFMDAGGMGLEVISGYTNPQEIHEMTSLCTKFQLLASTGSDYHADGMSMVSPGKQPALPSQCTPVWHNWDLGMAST